MSIECTTRGNSMSDRAGHAGPGDGSTRRQVIVGVVGTLGGLVLSSTGAWAAAEDGISHTAESIHQEPVFAASSRRVYEALTDAKLFTRVIQLSGALQAMHLPDKPAEISREAGGTFALYGGYITGRHVELVPNVRIVQAWRAGAWPAGIYSIARFVLEEKGAGTKIVFDHTGFPKGGADHLAAGWKSQYWDALGKFLV